MGVTVVLATAGSAHAHPLGNFTVNHYDGLRLHLDRVEDTAVLDTAEIPTLQEKRTADPDHDGRISDAERATRAAALCRDVAGALDARVDGHRLLWSIHDEELDFLPGAAGLQTSRLTCRLTADADLSRRTAFTFSDPYRQDRVGWHEVTASGSGVSLLQSSVPERSVSAELRHYPGDLLTAPLDLRSATLRTAPGSGMSGRGVGIALPSVGPVTRWVGEVNHALNTLVGDPAGSPLVGLLAVLLAFVLGAAHAALPGHGKTVLAAYLAGRRGTTRDALAVGATVTVTHTAGALVLGLLLAASASLAGEAVLGYLALASGLLVTAVGAALLRSAFRQRRRSAPRRAADDPGMTPTRTRTGSRSESTPRTDVGSRPTQQPPPWWWTPWQPEWRSDWQSPWPSQTALWWMSDTTPPATPTQGRSSDDDRLVESHPDAPRSRGTRTGDTVDDTGVDDALLEDTVSMELPVTDVALGDDTVMDAGDAAGEQKLNGHARPDVHGHDLPRAAMLHGQVRPGGPGADSSPPRGLGSIPGEVPDRVPEPPARQASTRTNSTGRGGRGRGRPGRAGLIGMGVAGGLVPSPSAVVVLLGAVALGHTGFGIALVLAHGLGIAATLTAAGLLLVHLRGRFARLRPSPRSRRVASWLHDATPFVAGTLVVVVGLTLAIRALLPAG